MHSSIRLDCDDADVREVLARWLDAAGLAPPGEPQIRVRIGTPAPVTGDSRPVFRQPTVEIRSGPPQGDVVVSWNPAPAVATLSAGAAVADVVLSPAAVTKLAECTATFFLNVLVMLLRRTGWHHVHAATAVDPGGQGWLLAGNAKAGKSTTAALLASRGWSVGTDDTAFLIENGDGVNVIAMRAPIALRREGYGLLQRQGGAWLERRQKMGFFPEELGGHWAPRIRPVVLAFPTVGDDRTIAVPLRPREALAELVRWSAWVVLEPDLAQYHLDLLTQLATQARAYRITLGRDLFDDPAVLERLPG